MKKWCLIFLILLLFTGCNRGQGENNKETEKMAEIEFAGKDFALNLDLSDGTGFEWMIVYKSDNIEMVGSSFFVFRKDKTETGGSGNKHIEFRIKDDKDGQLVLKCARPWEGDGYFKRYEIFQNETGITEIRDQFNDNYGDFDYVYLSSDLGWLRLNKLKSFESEEINEKDRFGFKVRPEGEEGYVLMYYSKVAEIDTSVQNWKKLTLTDKHYSLYYNEDEQSFDYIIGNNFFIDASHVNWQKDHFLDLIEMIDTLYYE